MSRTYRAVIPDYPRLPKPDWTRPGEGWWPDAESEWALLEDDDDRLCAGHWCREYAIAGRLDGRFYACLDHITKGLMWIEHGRIVSWRLRSPACSERQP